MDRSKEQEDSEFEEGKSEREARATSLHTVSNGSTNMRWQSSENKAGS